MLPPGWLLFFNLLKRDLRLRYAGAGLGSFWNIFQPLLLFVVYLLVFGYFLRFKARLLGREVDFLPFLFTGFWPWVAFSEGISRSSYVVLEYGVILKKVRFPSAILVPLAITVSLTPLAIGFLLLTIFLAFKGLLPADPLRFLWLFLPLCLQILFTLGLGFLVAVTSVYVRDFQQLLPSILNLWFFLTPVFYSLDMVPSWLRGILALNPWSIILSWYRQIFLAPSVRFGLGEGWLFLVSLVLLMVGYRSFQRGARFFPDIL